MKRYVITKEVLDLIHEADTDLNDIRRLIWSLPQIPNWATHFSAQTIGTEDPNGMVEVFDRFEEIPKSVPRETSEQ